VPAHKPADQSAARAAASMSIPRAEVIFNGSRLNVFNKHSGGADAAQAQVRFPIEHGGPVVSNFKQLLSFKSEGTSVVTDPLEKKERDRSLPCGEHSVRFKLSGFDSTNTGTFSLEFVPKSVAESSPADTMEGAGGAMVSHLPSTWYVAAAACDCLIA
jgi:hypothetical protein